MAHKHPIDHLFHQKLKNATKTPSPQTWERLESFLDAEQHTLQSKKKVAWMWVAASVLFLMLGYASWNYWQDKKTIAISKKNQPIYQKKYESEKLQSKNLKENKKEVNIQPNPKSEEWEQKPNKNIISKPSEKKSQKPLLDKENKEQKLPKEFLIQQNIENQVVQDNKHKEIEKNNPLENEKIIVTVKISSNKTPKTQVATSDNFVAERTRSKRKTGKIIESIRNFKNRDADEERKIFGIDKEKLMASIGKE